MRIGNTVLRDCNSPIRDIEMPHIQFLFAQLCSNPFYILS